MLDGLKYEYSATLSKIELVSQEQLEQQQKYQQFTPQLTYQHPTASGLPMAESDRPEITEEMVEERAATAEQQPFTRDQPKVGRNDPCSCGSGKKYKQCCGRVQ